MVPPVGGLGVYDRSHYDRRVDDVRRRRLHGVAHLHRAAPRMVPHVRPVEPDPLDDGILGKETPRVPSHGPFGRLVPEL